MFAPYEQGSPASMICGERRFSSPSYSWEPKLFESLADFIEAVLSTVSLICEVNNTVVSECICLQLDLAVLRCCCRCQMSKEEEINNKERCRHPLFEHRLPFVYRVSNCARKPRKNIIKFFNSREEPDVETQKDESGDQKDESNGPIRVKKTRLPEMWIAAEDVQRKEEVSISCRENVFAATFHHGCTKNKIQKP